MKLATSTQTIIYHATALLLISHVPTRPQRLLFSHLRPWLCPDTQVRHRLAGSPLGLPSEACWVTSEHANISTRAHQKIRSAVHDRTKCLARANEPPSRVDHSYVYASSVPLVPLLHPTSARWHVHEAVLLSIQLVDVCRGDKY